MRPFVARPARSLPALLLTIGAFALLAAPVRADGALDPSFGDSGRVQFGLASDSGVLGDLIALGDGSVVGVGRSDPGGVDLARITQAGLLDTAFGALDGLEDAGGNALVRLPDGRILAAGASIPAAPVLPTDDVAAQRALLLRFTRTGAADPAFGSAGRLAPQLPGFAGSFSAIRASGGGYVVGGTVTTDGGQRFVVTRVDRDGAPDPAFGDGGVVVVDPDGAPDAALTSLLIEPSGVIVAAGSATVAGTLRAAVVRLRPDGRPDPTFGSGDGSVTFRFGTLAGAAAGVALQPAGGGVGERLIVASAVGPAGRRRTALARLRTNGSLDPAFGRGGVTTAADPQGGGAARVLVNPNRTIVTAGGGRGTRAGALTLTRFLPDGALDTSFGQDGSVAAAARRGNAGAAGGLVRLADGRLVAAGSAGPPGVHEWLLARFEQACGTTLGCVAMAADGGTFEVAADPGARVRLGALVLRGRHTVGSTVFGWFGPGPATVGWNGRLNGARLPRGVYRIRLRTLDGAGRTRLPGPEIRLPVG